MKRLIYLLFFLILSGAVAGYIWYQSALTAKSDNSETQTVEIATGQGVESIATMLEEQNLISSQLAFKVYMYLNEDITLKAGTYSIEPATSTRRIISQLSGGETVSNEVNVLIREGQTVKEANEEIKKQGFLLDDSFLALAKTPLVQLPEEVEEFSFMAEIPEHATLEGYLFPDTYRLYKDFTAADLVNKMLANFDRKVTSEMREEIKKSGRTFHGTMIMASLLEKEVRTADDMKIAAGVFYNRLEVNQALQSCATLAYILGVNKPQYSYEDTQIDSPYNTYLNTGLPPGPVSNPGMRGINAAVYPAETDYVYFLNRPDTGETIFSKTLDEHNEAKAKYLE